MRRRRLVLLASVTLAGCPEKLPAVGDLPPERLGNATAAETTLVRAVCEAYEACANAYGRAWATVDHCIAAQLEGLDADLDAGGRHALDGDAGGCARAIEGIACNRLHLLPGVWETDIACAAVTREWGSHRIGDVPDGGVCTQEPGACAPGTVCEPDDAGGPRCRRCAQRAGLGDDCTSMECDRNLWCDTTASPVAACAAIDDKPCPSATDAECGQGIDHTCDPAGRVCRKRTEGDPCPEVDGTRNLCRSDDPKLVCIGGWCVQRSGVGAPCDDANDCSSFDMACIAGTCGAGASRDDTCTDDSGCKGFLVCSSGICTDLPDIGDECRGRCLPPLDCVNFVCRELPDELPAAGIGEQCSAVCGDGCIVRVATCSSGWCAPAGSNLPSTCEPFLGTGENCLAAAASPTGADGCDPATSYCRVSSPPNGVCAAFANLSADCSASACNPAEAYCDTSVAAPICRALMPIGGACVESAACAGRRCLGSCAGGTYEGLPCTSTAECGTGNVCSGECSGEDATWTGCAP